MLDAELFLGFPLSKGFAVKGPCEGGYERLVGEGSGYLQKIQVETEVFIGKKMGKEVDLEALRTVEAHIYSILQKSAPSHPHKETPLVLLTLHD